MARYIREQVLNQPEDFIQYMMNDFVAKHGFHPVEFKGEYIFRSGKGLLEIPKFMKWSYQNGVFHIEAWTRNAWLPGVYGRENAMTGYMGCIPKHAYKSDIDQLIGLLNQNVTGQNPMQQGMPGAGGIQPGAVGIQPGAVGMQPGAGGIQPGAMPQNGPVYVQGVDTYRYANMSLVMGIISIVLSCVPCIGIIFGSLGIVYGLKGQKSTKKGSATAGFVCGLIGLIIGIIAIVVYALYSCLL